VRVATQYAPAHASLTIISRKYENRQRLQFTTEFAKINNNNNTKKICTVVLFYQVCADTAKAKQSTENWAQAMLFRLSNKLIFNLLTLKLVSESRVT